MSGSLCTEVLGRVQAGWQAGKRVERLSVFANSTCLLLCYFLTSPPETATLTHFEGHFTRVRFFKHSALRSLVLLTLAVGVLLLG
jgi:hypothetical protein